MSNHDPAAVVHQSPSAVGKQHSTPEGGMKRSGSSIFKNGMLVSFRNISYKVRNAHKRKEMITLVDGVSGYLRGGELVALMGPSGCGESTLSLLCYSVYFVRCAPPGKQKGQVCIVSIN